MNLLKDYIIPIEGLKDGLYHYNYHINKSFTDQFNYQDIVDIYAQAKVTLKKVNTMLDFSIIINGKILAECDRCLDEFYMDIAFENNFTVKLDDNIMDDDEEMIYIPSQSKEFDIAPYIFETIVFAIPMKKIHPFNKIGESLCNPEFISKLNRYTVSESVTNDPRWDKLKELLN